MKQFQIRQQIDSIILYLEKYWSFSNCHMVNYFTDDHWNNLMPEEIKNHVISHDINNIILNTFWNQNNNTLSPVENFLNSCKIFWLDNMNNIAISVDEFYENINLVPDIDPIHIKGFMGEKKMHEVEITSELIANIVTSFKNEEVYIVDAGDGKGYLSSRLVLEHKLKVLGIDANEINSDGAINRTKKLQRVWKSLIQKEEIKEFENQPLDIEENYRVVTKFICSALNFEQIIRDQFNLNYSNNINICLTGLHTCGNLASTCLKAYSTQNYIISLCNIGCCYHLINEEFFKDDFFVNKNIASKNSDFGFPLSSYLREKKIEIGRNARMLAAQSIHRNFSSKKLPDKSLFYRALLEEIIVTEIPDLKNVIQVGKIKNSNSFGEYFQKCNKKLKLNLSHITEEYLKNMEKKYLKEENKLYLFYLLRMCLAPIIESLILLDRLLFLYENKLNNSYLIKLFDPVVSPRCYAIVSIK